MLNAVVQIGNFSYFPERMVGQGATGSVFMGTFFVISGFRNQDQMPVAVKIIRLKEIDTPVKQHLLECEVAGLLSVKGRYVCKAFDVLKDQ